MLPRISILAFLIIFAGVAVASDPYPRNENIDVQHYTFKLSLNDSTDVIAGEADVTIRFRKGVTTFDLNLIGKNGKGAGMEISLLKSSGKPVQYTHINNVIHITLDKPTDAGDLITFTIAYQGIPEDGLIIGKNKFGDRGFFGDNWPDRGRYWLPSVDHPSDKARVDFIVTAPDHYQVVATGKLVEESDLPRKRRSSHWKESIDVAVKVMTIGVARFAVELSGEVGNIPITTWVYPQNRSEGFYDFAVAPRVLDFFQHYIGPFPYEKLAHVQSKTRWGGLENASNIFYFENSVTGKNEHEGLIAHETAHQWFGNSATEDDWHHVWLSEGFATYFTALYMENIYGRDRLVEQMKANRKQVVDYFKKQTGPVVDTTITDIGKVLSTNTYQKGGWVLHMLRKEVGDEKFHAGIREYYRRYAGSNALTADFRKVMEEVSGKDLSGFFSQWLYRGGHPQLKGTWSYDTKAKAVVISLEQVQTGAPFQANLEIGLLTDSGERTVQTAALKSKSQEFRFPAEKRPVKVVLDPDTWTLFEGEIVAK